VADEVFAELASRGKEVLQDAILPEDFETVKVDPMTGRLMTEDDMDVPTTVDHSSGDYLQMSERVSVPVRTSSSFGKGVSTVYDAFIRNTYIALRSLLLFVGSIFVLSCKSPNVEPLMS